MTRQHNRTEGYLHERVQKLFEANPDPILFEIALRALVEEVATACGLFIAEMHSTDMLATWVGRFLGKMDAFRAGTPQEIRIGPSAVPLDLGRRPDPDPCLDMMPEAPALVDTLEEARALAPAAFIWGSEVRMQRKALQLRQVDLAARVGIKQEEISRLELDRAYGNLSLYLALRTVLGMPVEEYAYD